MQTRQLGTTDFQITVIGLGAWAIGGPDYAFGWGPQDDADSIAAIHRAVDSGINWIDTAAIYGLGRSERVVAQALKSLGSSRRPYVFTKGSLVWDDKGTISHSLKKASLRKEVDDSLRRLETDVIDLYQVHWSKPWGSDAPASDIEEGWQTLADLQKAGKLRHIGVSNFDVSEMDRLRPIARIASLQPPYSMLRRAIEKGILPYCQAHRIGVIVYSPMAAGILTGAMTRERAATLPANDWRSKNPELQEPKLTQNLTLVEVLAGIGTRHGRLTAGAVAVAWTLCQPAVTGAIVGFRNAAQVDGIIDAASFRLSDDEIQEIEAYLPPVKTAGR
ncbi:MAG: aldo/keto reductase [Acidobacteria bacterium]|nr:aldo/keto reductase [Acidobacteriota bacterium]